jgi:6-phosphogluconolactonase
MAQLEVYPDARALARAAAERFVGLATDAIEIHGRFGAVLSGGSSPRATYQLLADEFAASLDWGRVHFFWGDERNVGPDHPESNYAMVRRALLDRIPVKRENIHRIKGELPPQQAAAAYIEELDGFLGTDGEFDLVMLGMGTDGHTASLFPGSRALQETRPVTSTYVEHLRSWRITMTLPLLNSARSAMLIVSGASKAPTLARVLGGESLPAALIKPAGELVWLVDQAAHPDAG